MSTNDPLGGLGNLLGDATGSAGSGGLPAGLGDAIGGLLAGGGAGGTGTAGLEDLVKSFNDAGLERQVQSWIGRGPNQPVTADEIGKALGPERVQQLASIDRHRRRAAAADARGVPAEAHRRPDAQRSPAPAGRAGAAGGPMDAIGGILKGLGG